MNVEPITLFNHKIWETQVDSFEHGITLSYESFKDNPKFVNKKNRDEKFIALKQTDSNSNSDDFYLKYSKQKEIFEKKIKFNLIEKIYFKLRRLMESRKKDVKNY